MLITVVGSYPKIPNRPRPARLRQAIARFERGEMTAEELARVEYALNNRPRKRLGWRTPLEVWSVALQS